MISVEEKKVVFGQGDILVQARENLELYVFRLGGNYEVGETVKDEEEDYEFVTGIQSSADGWYEAYETLNSIEVPDSEIKVSIGGVETTIIFAGDKWMDSIKIVKKAIMGVLLLEVERLEELENKTVTTIEYKNSKGETTWLNRSRNVAGITESDIEVIKESLKDSIKQSERTLEDLNGVGVSNLDEVGMAAFDHVKSDVEYETKLLSEIEQPRNINEDGWRHIFAVLVKDDNQDWLKMLPGADLDSLKSDEYYDKLRDTTYRVELVSGIAGMYNG